MEPDIEVDAGEPAKSAQSPARGLANAGSTAHPFASRPRTLAEVAARTNAGEAFSFKLAEFLDTYYGHLRNGRIDEAQASIGEEPELLADIRMNAYIAGVAEHLARRWSLPRIPVWTNSPSRFLKRPYFAAENSTAKALYFVESPIAFRRRLIFVEAQPLRRASMPVSR